ncbi:ABC transporter permease [Oceanobacillus picturae]|uniref:ABC transporter permease n=1 Tax=Oceanobacillus picturae TaxID=171693 RepID=A0A0U9HBJ9_9BACI|nr:hypothetical protein [Oceanobacillus picturae]GAQ17576.1 ABC transporter permease [Oceanobacillus picturae]
MSMHASDSMFAFLTFLPFILYLVVIVFAVYFVIKVIKFMNEKVKLDREKNEKLTEIVKVLNQEKRD